MVKSTFSLNRAIKHCIISGLIVVGSLIILTPKPALAANPTGNCKYISSAFTRIFCDSGSGDLNSSPVTLINQIADFLTGLLGIALVVSILVSAIQIITSSASPDLLISAKRRMGNSALALGLLIGLRAILLLIGI